MLFNSTHFVLFFPLVVGLFFALPHRWRWSLLLAASYYFYMCWKPEYAVLIVASTLVDYWATQRMGRHEDRGRRKKYLILSLVSNLGLLAAFKYFNFFNESARAVFDRFDIFYGVPAFDVLLPVGISFYTFQTLSYSIDVYRGKQEPERHLGYFALYVAFFPQLVAGPIERPGNLLPQFRKQQYFDNARAVSGMRQALWGFFKKLVVADRLAIYVEAVYSNPEHHNATTISLATVLFAVQIYCDFSAYSDIAIGTARVMGYDLMENFHRPYFARSISEFWRRWHISLSTWFRDYLYIPLGGNRVSVSRWYVNLFIVFVVSGLWHGARWTFVIWGALHGLYLVFALLTQGVRARAASAVRIDRAPLLRALWQIACVFVLVNLAWVFFRANTTGDALLMLGKIVRGEFGSPWIGDASVLAHAVIGLGILTLVELAQEFGRGRVTLYGHQSPVVRHLAYVLTACAIVLFGVFDGGQFIYFQF